MQFRQDSVRFQYVGTHGPAPEWLFLVIHICINYLTFRKHILNTVIQSRE